MKIADMSWRLSFGVVVARVGRYGSPGVAGVGLGCRWLLCSLLVCGCWSAGVDPWVETDRMSNLRLLEDLRARWGSADQSDACLAVAQMAMVNLALTGDLRDVANRGGVWRERAREVGSLRTKGASSFHDRIPQLWSLALDGYSQQVLDEIAAPGADADSPHCRALRCLAMGDWRPLLARKVRTQHERWALSYALSLANGSMDGSFSMRSGGVTPLGQTEMRMHDQGEVPILRMQPREAIRQACLLLRGEQMSRPEIRPIVDRLSAIARTSSGDLASVASGLDRDPVRLDAMAWLVDLADLCASGPRGVRGVGGEWILVGTGDVAIDAEMHLLLVMKHLLQRPMADNALYADEVREYLSSHDAGLVSYLLRRCVLNDDAVDDRKLDAVEDIRKKAVFPALFLNGVLDWYGSRRTLSRKRKMADQLMQDHIIREGDRPAGWSSFLKNGAPRSAVGQDALARIAQADPWNAEVALAIGGPDRSEDEVAARFPWRPGLINVGKAAAGGAPAKKKE